MTRAALAALLVTLSCQVLASILALKAALPEYVHLNRGNHEDESLAYAYDFAAEVTPAPFLSSCLRGALLPVPAEEKDDSCGLSRPLPLQVSRKYGRGEASKKILALAGDCFALLPLAATFNGTWVIHGGLPRAADASTLLHDSGSAVGSRASFRGRVLSESPLEDLNPWGLDDLRQVRRDGRGDGSATREQALH